jgi:hypothetical protein
MLSTSAPGFALSRLVRRLDVGDAVQPHSLRNRSVLTGRRRRIPTDALGEFVRSLRGSSSLEVA